LIVIILVHFIKNCAIVGSSSIRIGSCSISFIKSLRNILFVTVWIEGNSFAQSRTSSGVQTLSGIFPMLSISPVSDTFAVAHQDRSTSFESIKLYNFSHKLTIGDDCAISWNCQFLDDDHQEIFYSDKQQKKNGIIIGNHVWIGCGAQIYKGTVIPNGCVIASNSVVKAEFTSQNSLIGGVPARIIKSNVEWD